VNGIQPPRRAGLRCWLEALTQRRPTTAQR
jgi:hypothetical protein